MIQHLVVQHVRNLLQVEIELHQRVNLFCGDNAQGKTNLLEAVALCCSGRPLRCVGSSSEHRRISGDRAGHAILARDQGYSQGNAADRR